MPPGEGIRLELVEENELSGGDPTTADDRPRRYRAMVNCGKPVTGMEIEVRGDDGEPLPDRGIGKVFVRGASVMHSYFRDEESTSACLSDDGWLDTGDMGYMSDGYIFIVGRAKDMIIINGRNHWPQDIEWAVEQLPGFKSGDIAAFAITGPSGEETPAVLVHCRVSDAGERGRLRDDIRERVRAITGITPVVELIPPRTLPAHQLGQAVADQGAQPLSVGRNPALRHRRLSDSSPRSAREDLYIEINFAGLATGPATGFSLPGSAAAKSSTAFQLPSACFL